MTTHDTAPLAHTVPAACTRLGLSRTKLYELIGAGEIRAFKVGSRTLVSESELRRFVAEKMKVAA